MVTRHLYEKELERLNTNIIKMAGLVEKSLFNALKALEENDKEMGKQVHDDDDAIDELEGKIEKMCIALIAKEQPIASDLRFISAALKIITDMERVADNAVDIAEILEGSQAIVSLPQGIITMGEETKKMFTSSIDAFVRRDVTLARNVCMEDDVVDRLYNQNITEITESMKENNTLIDNCVSFIFLTRYLERIADHATNICEWIIYYETGKHEHMN